MALACIGSRRTRRRVTHSEGLTGREVVISLPAVSGSFCIYGIDKRLRERAGVQGIDVL